MCGIPFNPTNPQSRRSRLRPLLVAPVLVLATSSCGGGPASSGSLSIAPPAGQGALSAALPPSVSVPAAGVIRKGVIRRLAANQGAGPVVGLTFDDGPDPKWTPRVLALLRATGVKATFCMIGRSAARYPDLVRAVAAEGHVVCDHTQNHVEGLDRRPPAVVRSEIEGGAQSIARILGRPPAFYRPPGGSLSPLVIATANQLGMRVLAWSDDPKDWTHPPAPAILSTTLRELTPGGVVLMHDDGGDRSATVAQLGDLIRQLTLRGYRFAVPR